ncbi:MAG: YifB family Mg chelatase-like AAA ATPase [Verrucomicrobia bacterium]|nr:YifB family Mg chelatase-like AAA ATPase [Verrucomicrobiota bacterium]
MLSVIRSGALVGVEAVPVEVEVNSGEIGEFGLWLVGLPDAAVKESEDRVTSALQNAGLRLPETRTTINLAPGDLRKEGAFYDLPIALGLAAATGQLDRKRLGEYLIAGELGLSGGTRPVRGGVAFALLARRMGLRGVVLPRTSATEAALVPGIEAFAADSLDGARRFLNGDPGFAPLPPTTAMPVAACVDLPDFSEVKGQLAVRRAVEVAAAGGHNLLLIGPPGSGKSLIAKRIPTVLPEPDAEERLEILSVHSAAGACPSTDARAWARPFRSPHHTISDIGLIGGGSMPGPGEVSLAHRGVLFLDELPEFRRSALEVLRQPLEDGQVIVSRAAAKVTLPSRIMLVAAMNPCPCGHLGDRMRECRCAPAQIRRYRSRVSGPLLDRIDVQVEAPALTIEELRSAAPGESSAEMRSRVEAARAIQRLRFSGRPGGCNAVLGGRDLREHCALERAQGDLLQQAMEKLGLSARAYDRILRVARTVADLSASERIATAHLLEAIHYRSLDRG